ncbi:MAG: hypothetical protein EOQ42_16090 [Mesorhizobium sp.]|uniref:hypothetical protein n=1 Tax=Mesorhizobium sp. TaxID=1871066 RepID=UPI000FE5A179|nr:hypothetical protein [Mesorhizobium sp.]RWB33777.1 MAG: hypothetical protein EOQ43_02620 [Mesorhizobium sp.]RWB65427.1 MAG: hypothetical protein EOQ42_16090 [Mesorhizobium sp.]RWD08293.1 MAG: hypothetical protein EOS57_24555 [Mesorhizobium sp.]TIU73257.1 MAG: hypothetical protein E5W13_24285 [Mesorhizobium sp.]
MAITCYRSASSTGDVSQTVKGKLDGRLKPDLAITFSTGTYQRLAHWEVLIGYRDFKALAKAMMEASPKSARTAFRAALGDQA